MEHQEQQIWTADEPTGAAAWQAETTDGWTRVVDDRKQRGIDCAPTTRSIWAPPTMRTELVASDSRFPEGLHHVEAPPGCIRLLGDPALLTRPALAIVGARKASPYGLEAAGHFARCAVLRGITIVSGGAIGCDQAAHRGALDAGGRTIVVLGCGADIIYPMRARGLFERVLAEGGTIISEAPWGSSPSKWGFRRRNRLIAGLAQATLIVEAGLPSGTFITADATLAQGKDVLAIPGSIFALESRGANRLIAQGAVPIVDDAGFEDALTMIFGQSEQPKEPSDQESEGGARDSREG
ncbi:MAG: DNA-processing protein DprA, partial [Coriobacteriales bacterium]|nr:DNA-processing protein DprA [Coriobacteriales bacterium]